MQHESFICGVVSLTQGFLGTGFAIGKRGDSVFILTAGHVIQDIRTPAEIMRLQFVFQGSKLAMGRMIIGHSDPTEENGGLDFAIIQAQGKIKDVVPARLKVWTRPDLPHTLFHSIGAAPNASGGIGFKDYAGAFEGKITRDTQSESWRYRTKTTFPILEGYSGSPLIVGKGRERVVIGVHTHRNRPPQESSKSENAAEALHFLNFATPVARILDAVPNLQQFIDGKSPWYGFEKLHVLLPSPGNTEVNRTCLQVRNGDPAKFENRTGDIVHYELAAALKQIHAHLAACSSWLSSKPVIGYDPLIPLFRPDDPEGTWEAVLNDGVLRNDQLRRLRAVIDCDTGLPATGWEHLPLESSHGLLIALQNGPPAEHADFGDGILTVVDHDQESQARSVLRRMEDLMLDINVFYRNPVLSGLFSTLETKRSFDVSKREYIQGRYRAEAPSLAALAREPKTGDFDPERYRCLWSDFMENWLLPGLLEIKGPVTATKADPTPFLQVAEEHFTKVLKATGKLHGQISSAKLRRACMKYATEGTPTGGVLALAILVKRPKQEQDRVHLQNFFGAGAWHLKKVTLVDAFKFPELFRWLPYLHVVFLDITFKLPSP
jgi:hypothetical protein